MVQYLSVKDNPQIAIQANTSVLHCSTIKVKGTIKRKRLQVFVDSGSNHNLLDIAVSGRVGCNFKEINSMKVVIANGSVINCSGICRSF